MEDKKVTLNAIVRDERQKAADQFAIDRLILDSNIREGKPPFEVIEYTLTNELEEQKDKKPN